ESVLRVCATDQPASEPRVSMLGEAPSSGEPSGHMLETVTALARMDIVRVIERALGAAQPGADNLVFVGSSLLRKTCRGLSAVDRELAALLCAEPRFPVQAAPRPRCVCARHTHGSGAVSTFTANPVTPKSSK